MHFEQLGKLVKLLPSVSQAIERDSEDAFRELGEKMGNIGGGMRARPATRVDVGIVAVDLLSYFLAKKQLFPPARGKNP